MSGKTEAASFLLDRRISKSEIKEGTEQTYITVSKTFWLANN
jgi:hypothetical protein